MHMTLRGKVSGKEGIRIKKQLRDITALEKYWFFFKQPKLIEKGGAKSKSKKTKERRPKAKHCS